MIGYEAGYYAGAAVDAAKGGAVSDWARGNVSDTALGVAYHGVGIALALTGIGAVSRAIGGSGARAATRAVGRMAGGKSGSGLKGAAGVVDDAVRGLPAKLPNFNNRLSATEHWLKHAKGLIHRAGTWTRKAGGPDLPEFANSLDDYIWAARRLGGGLGDEVLSKITSNGTT